MMSSILRWDPVREFEEFSRRLVPLFGRLTHEIPQEERQDMRVIDWAPTVDIAEEDSAYLVTAELPEVKKEDAKVAIENGVLTISGERKKETEEKNGRKYHRIERSYGSFMRSFSLPDDADPSRVTANMKDGVLHVKIEKRVEAKPKTVAIEVK
jgi:HSP20 family protein